MKTKMILVLFLFLLCAKLPAPDAGGHGGGLHYLFMNGGEFPDRLDPWFKGENRRIRYCIEATNDFGSKLQGVTLKSQIENAFTTWQKYIDQKNIKENLATNLTYLETCNGSQDLTFYLGVKSAEVKEAVPDFFRAISYSYLKEYNASSGWGKGFIWIADMLSLTEKGEPVQNGQTGAFPLWTKSPLTAILLHEIGHVLGNAHAYGTIMTPDIGDAILRFHNLKGFELSDQKEGYEKRFNSIDWTFNYGLLENYWSNVYVQCGTNSAEIYSASIFGIEGSLAYKSAAEEFLALTGKKTTGIPRVKVRRDKSGVRVTLFDNHSSFDFDFTPDDLEENRDTYYRERHPYWHAFGSFISQKRESVVAKLKPEQRLVNSDYYPAKFAFEFNVEQALKLSIIFPGGSSKLLAFFTGDGLTCQNSDE